MTGQGYDPAIQAERIALVDLLDRVLAGGVVIAGDVTLSIADVDLVTVSLRALVTSVSALIETPLTEAQGIETPLTEAQGIETPLTETQGGAKEHA